MINEKKTFRSIEISGVNSLPAEILNEFLALHSNLTELELSPLSVTDDMTLSFISALPALQSLHIGYIQKEAQKFPMEPLAFCNTIQNLHIQVSNAYARGYVIKQNGRRMTSQH